MNKWLFLFLAFWLSAGVFAQSDFQVGNTTLKQRILATDLFIPWDLDMDANGDLWFTQRDGYLCKLDPEEENPVVDTVYFVPDLFQSAENSGLHALALHPKFPIVPQIFIYYTYDLFGGRLMRLDYSIRSNQVTDTSYVMNRVPGNSSHNGARIVFENDSLMYVCMGDAYTSLVFPQDTQALNGKVWRIKLNGEAPADNPFQNEVWSLGHRNPQGLVFGSNGILYESEHGTSIEDEINIIKKGRNYGWPEVEGYCDNPSEQKFCEDANVAEPIFTWTPTDAPGGLAYFDHPSIPEWQNSLLQSFLKAKRVSVLHLNAAGDQVKFEEKVVDQEVGRIRDVFVAPNGKVYYCTSNNEPNGAGVVQPDDDKIIEIYNPNYTYESNKNDFDIEAFVFPNPADQQLQIRFEKEYEWVDIELIDRLGNVIESSRISPKFLETTFFPIERYALRDGVYFLTLHTSEGTSFTEKVVFINQ